MQKTVKVVGYIVFVAVLAFIASLGSKPAEDTSTPQAENALIQGEWQEQGVQDSMDTSLLTDRFSEPREVAPGCWMRSNYGLFRIEDSFLELSPLGDRFVWENFGKLTSNTRQVVASPGVLMIEDFLSGGRAAWGTLSVHLSGSDPDNAEVIGASFIPIGPAFAYDATSYE